MTTIFDHLRQCAANGDTPTLDAEDARRIVETYDELLGALGGIATGFEAKTAPEQWLMDQAGDAIKRATESRPLQIERG